jgi:hypothetical protein
MSFYILTNNHNQSRSERLVDCATAQDADEGVGAQKQLEWETFFSEE